MAAGNALENQTCSGSIDCSGMVSRITRSQGTAGASTAADAPLR
jgi:hypothetical protein